MMNIFDYCILILFLPTVICFTVQSDVVMPGNDLPPECEEYLVLDDPTRNVNHGWRPYCDDNNFNTMEECEAECLVYND